MRRSSQSTLLRLVLAVVVLVGACGAAVVASQSQRGLGNPGAPSTTGFMLVVPDRGFLGNEETRDAAAVFVEEYNAELVFVTDERTRQGLERALGELRSKGAREIVVLPLFLSASDPRLQLVRAFLGQAPGASPGSRKAVESPVPVRFAKPFGESYLAVEILSDRLRAIESASGKRLIVVGYGAVDAESRRSMEADWQRIAVTAARGFGFESVHSMVWHDLGLRNHEELSREAAQALARTAYGAEHVVVVPFHLGKKLDSMMTFTGNLRRFLPKGAHLVAEEVTPHPAVPTWMAREANRYLPLTPHDVGVVFLAHGSDYHWNETMEQAVEPLARRYKIEFAFCMADQALVERAIRRLEQRGARAIVIVRVFGLASSFQDTVERMIGLDVEGGSSTTADDQASHGDAQGHESHEHSHGRSSAPPPRIRSTAVMTTVGGLEAHPLFAAALLDRAKTLSRDPQRETVILVAHGEGEDARNEDWLRNLEAMASTMWASGGGNFRAIRVGTWREDWPDKRERWVRDIRRMVEEARENGGRAIVVPARTTGQGPERELLSGLEYELGSGFAPHPLFARWVEEQIREGMLQLGVGNDRRVASQAVARPD